MNTAEQTVNSTQKTLGNLLSGLVCLDGLPHEALSIVVSGVGMDSRLLSSGDLFFACFGKNHDARQYIAVAISRGACAVLAEAGGVWSGVQYRDGVPVIAVEGLSARIGHIAARFHDYPSRDMVVTGITGTNGKTSCTQFLAQALTQLGHSCGVIGTLGYGRYPQLQESGYTTPDALMVQSALAQMRRLQCDNVAMEVSSQGLHQHRVNGVCFHTAVFTNLTRDHLDYHQSMESYGDAKKKLFLMEELSVAVVNADDAYAPSILNSLHSSVRSYTYSISSKQADVCASRLELGANGYSATVHTPWGEGALQGSLLGKFNFSNVLAVLTTLLTSPLTHRFSFADMLAVIAGLKPVDGRMEIVGSSDNVTAVVDYAHTPDALQSALVALRQHYNGKIWCVFGCGGNRDQGKRPLMAEVAEKQADHLIITDDNPRTEAADDIVKQILLGVEDRSRVFVQRDRAQAITWAVNQAAPGDVVLVAGKGHENYQDIGGTRMAFSDVAQVRLALQSRGSEFTKPEAGQ